MKFSVAIPTYKRPEELKRAIKSVVTQRLEPFELIVVSRLNDFSTNKVIASSIEQYSNIEIKHAFVEDAGFLPPIFEAVRIAKGDVLALLGKKAWNRSIDGILINTHEQYKDKRRPYTPLFVTWAIMGFWHGANWTFILWGLIHATCIVVHRLVLAPASRLPRFMRVWGGWAINLLVMMLAWIPFRAQSVEVALKMYGKLFCLEEWLWLGMRENTYLVAAFLLGLVALSFYVHESSERWFRTRRWLKFFSEVLVISAATGLVFVFLRPINQFIYFQF